MSEEITIPRCPYCGDDLGGTSNPCECEAGRVIGRKDAEIAALKQRLAEQPTKALGRGSDTTLVPTVRAQTTEGMLEAARAEIAALRAECARNARALKRAMEALRRRIGCSGDGQANIEESALADITKILQEP